MVNGAKKYGLFSIYLFGFLFAFRTALPTYINSSFIDALLPEKYVGVIYVIASVLSIVCFFLMPWVLRRFGNYRTALTLLLVNMVALLGLAIFTDPIFLVILFICSLVTISLIYFSSDIFLEGYSPNNQTGLIRGVYLTSVNLAWALSPLISGLILSNGDYWKIYLASFVLLLPVLLILVSSLKGFKDSTYQVTDVRKTLSLVWKNKNLRNILSASFLLSFFYSWMVIYTPLYLHKDIGFSWEEIGIIFFVMLLPFVIVQFPLGRLADKKWGEKEILSVGFITLAISTGVIFFIDSSGIILWAVILFITRLGASAIEIMCDTYFFKKVSGLEANIISFYRMAGPAGYVIGPLLATLILSLVSGDIRFLFLILGVIMLFGLKFSLSLKDTK